MALKLNRLFIISLALSLFLILPTAQGKKMYRWHDENGNVYFSDKVPPEHSKHKRESLTGKARVIKGETIEKAKSKDKIELGFRLKALRQEQKKILAKQQAHDRVIRSTFRTVEDMEEALKRKTLVFESELRGRKKRLEFLENDLLQLQKTAANFERNGKKIPQKTLDLIIRVESNISQTETSNANFNITKQEELKQFKADIKRFKFLTAVDVQDKSIIDEKAETKAANALGLYTCNDLDQCRKAWNIAKQFVLTHSDTPIELESEELVMTGKPNRNQNLSLSLSKLTKNKQQPQIFLDIRCHTSSSSYTVCSEAKIRQLRASFRPHIISKLTAQ
jgi:hypothetical protein